MDKQDSTIEDISMEPNDTPEGWQAECERAVLNISNLLYLAGRRQTGTAVLEMMRSAPRTPQEMERLTKDSLLYRCALEITGQCKDGDFQMVHSIISFFEYLLTMPPSRRSMLEASVAGVMLGWGMGW